MRFVVYGAGAIGGVLGMQLYRHGHEVALIARGAHLAAIQTDGLTCETPQGTHVERIPAFGHPSEVAFRRDDVVILTMKSQHTEDALNTLRAAAGDAIPVICCQNGVANERMALRRFANVYAMLVYMPAEQFEPGVVRSHAGRKVGILDTGRYPAGTDDTITAVCAALEASRFSAKPTADVMRWKYGKLVLNLGNAMEAAIRPVEAEAGRRREIQIAARQEAEACFAAAGIACSSRQEERARRQGEMEIVEIEGRPRQGGSSLQSLKRGAGNIEADWLNGEIVLLGRLYGVPTPVNRALQNLANELAASGGEAQSVPLADLERRVAAAG